MLAAQPMVHAQGPDLQVGKGPVDPRQDDVRSHLADDMGIMGDAGGSRISGPTIGLGRPWSPIAKLCRRHSPGRQTLRPARPSKISSACRLVAKALLNSNRERGKSVIAATNSG